MKQSHVLMLEKKVGMGVETKQILDINFISYERWSGQENSKE